MEGGSNRTIAYKKTMELFRAATGSVQQHAYRAPAWDVERQVSAAPPAYVSMLSKNTKSSAKPAGCLGILVIGFTLLVSGSSALSWIIDVYM